MNETEEKEGGLAIMALAYTIGISFIAAVAVMFAMTACTTATATRTSNGVTASVQVKSFLSTIQNGKFSVTNADGTAMSLSTDQSTPDQQSISILAGTVGDIAKGAMLLATNRPEPKPTPPPVVVVTNTFTLPR